MDWQRLARYVVARRTARGYHTREAFADALHLSGRILGDIENARKMSYRPSTLARIEEALAWEPGSIDRILTGEEPTEAAPIGVPISDVLTLARMIREILASKWSADTKVKMIEDVINEIEETRIGGQSSPNG